MKKSDIILSLISGIGVGWIAYGLVKGIGFETDLLWLVFVVFPALSVLGLRIAYMLGDKYPFVPQVAKFLLTGVLAVIVDLGVLNALISLFGIAQGMKFVAFKTLSFIVATFSKFWGNKFWAFERTEQQTMKTELFQFYAVTLIGLAINVGVASFIVNVVGPQFEINLSVWANIGSIIAAVVGALWNFLGYKFFVFKK